MSHIPVIDFTICGLDGQDVSPKELKDVGTQVVDAFSHVGFVYLKNVGIKKELIEKVNGAFKTLIESPLESKKKYSITSKFHGYVADGVENVNPKCTDHKEAFIISGAALTDDEDFPWPDDLSPGLSYVVKEFMSKCKLIAHRLLETIAIGLDLDDKQHFLNCHSKMNEKGNPTTLRCNYYAPKESISPGQIRFGEHSDYLTVTLLFQDDVGGLQIKNSQGEYIDATPIDDTVLVNIGDTLQFWTKYKLKSTKHRVVAPHDSEKRKRIRQSLVYFVGANDGTVIGDLPVASESKEYDEFFSQIEGKITTDQFMKLRMEKNFQY